MQTPLHRAPLPFLLLVIDATDYEASEQYKGPGRDAGLRADWKPCKVAPELAVLHEVQVLLVDKPA